MSYLVHGTKLLFHELTQWVLQKDDSYINCKAAEEFGWTAAHLVEDSACVPRLSASKHQIKHIEELRDTFPQFFRMCEKL